MGVGRDVFGRKKNGDIFPVEIGLSPFVEDGKTYISISVIDITYRKTLEKNLTDKNILLSEMNSRLDSFANVAAHDLKSPLRTISGFSDLLLGKLSKTLDSDSVDFLNRIKTSASRLTRLIETLLEFSVKIEEIKMESVDLSIVIKNVLSDISEVIKNSKTIVKVESLPLVKGNEIQLYQVFLNIISNSIKYSKKSIEPIIYIRGGKKEENFFIEVEDNGIGFDQKKAELIFQPFERLVGYDEYEGFGIGLATVKKIISNHKGSVEVKSIIGEGSVFIIYLPCS
jgi:light-regulated signal transduction histidine kinase (bacteriophytochrome)